ncbi:MAG: sigma 54-interacting transcriptional regulator [Gemmatimonadetes bacterium]|nr:sigma 54-interacting transcriptional regulator [Gemmatimonadota bacterium]
MSFSDCDTAPSFIDRSIPFVGRERELASLSDYREKAHQNGPTLVLISGEAGIGKSRLVQEFGHWLVSQGDFYVQGSAVTRQGANPYRPFVEILRNLIGIERELSAQAGEERLHAALIACDISTEIFYSPLRDLLSGNQAASLTADSADIRRHVLFEGMVRLLQAEAKKRPVALFLDDLQWADEVVFDLADYLISGDDGTRLLLLGAYRPEEITSGNQGIAHPLSRRLQGWLETERVFQFGLSRFGEETVNKLVEKVIAEHSGWTGELHRQTEGLPLFVVEYLKAFRQEDPTQGLKLPQRARQIIDYRLGRLAAEDRMTLRIASLLGETFDGDLLVEVMGEPRAHVFLRLERVKEVHQLLKMEDAFVYRFSHARIREVLQNELSPQIHQVYCLTAAEMLEEKGEESWVFDLAYLFREGGDLHRAARYAARAAVQAQQLHAYAEAKQHARAAMGILNQIEELAGGLTVEVCETAGHVLKATDGARDEVLLCFEQALAACQDPLRRADVHCWIADLHGNDISITGLYAEHVEAARREVGEQVESVQMARVRHRLSLRDDARFILSGCLKALELFERISPHDPEVFDLYHGILVALSELGEAERMERYAYRFHQWVEGREDPVLSLCLHQVMGHVYRVRGLFHREVDELERALDLARRLRYLPEQAPLHYALAWTRIWLGEAGAAEAHWREALRLEEDPALPSFVFIVELASVFSRAGHHDRALALLEESLEAPSIVAEWNACKDALTYYRGKLGYIERIFHRAGRTEEFAEYCRKLQQREAENGHQIDGVWVPVPARVDSGRWEGIKGNGGGGPDLGNWKWEDRYGVCKYWVQGEDRYIQVNTVVGFNGMTMPSLLLPVEGDFALEVQVASEREVQAAADERRDQTHTGEFDLSHPIPGAAGLLVCNDQDDAIRLIAHLHEGGSLLFDLRKEKEKERIGLGRAWLSGDRPIALRLERKGDLFQSYGRVQGGDWLDCGKVEFPLGWRVQAGICAEIPVECYSVTRRVESRFSGIHLYRPRLEQDQIARQEEDMLRELSGLLTDGRESLERFEEGLLQALGCSVEAEWGQYVGVDGQGRWIERCRWTGSDGEVPEHLPALPSRIGKKASVVDTGGKVVCIPLVDGKTRSGGWILGREERFTPPELALLDHAGRIAGVLLDNKHRREEEQRQEVHVPQGGSRHARFPEIISHSAAMELVFRDIERIASGAAPVLIQGESGTGKELIARAIHDCGPRRDEPFIAQNCAALPDSLLESELFGYRKGAFTGATGDKPGLFEVAEGGTLFLDEIADASAAVQAKLLRAVEEGEIRRVGDIRNTKVNVRIISATSRDMAEQVQQGRLREDLHYRLNVVQVVLPPLRDRREDIPLLAEFFLQKISQRDGKEISGFTQGAMDLLCAYPWPGNVRELQNEIERCVTITDEERAVGAEELSPAIRGIGAVGTRAMKRAGSLQQMLEHVEQIAIREALERCEGNVSRVARELGLSRSGLHNKMKKYGLQK